MDSWMLQVPKLVRSIVESVDVEVGEVRRRLVEVVIQWRVQATS